MSQKEISTVAYIVKTSESLLSLAVALLDRPLSFFKTEQARNLEGGWVGCDVGPEPFMSCRNSVHQKPSDRINSPNGGFNVK
mgnify:CR=1 FL=1